MSEPSESPPTETQTGRQLHDPPGSGKGLQEALRRLDEKSIVHIRSFIQFAARSTNFGLE